MEPDKMRDNNEKYIVVEASGSITDDKAEVAKEDSRDLRSNAADAGSNKDGEKVRVNIAAFTANHYLVNTSGTIAKNKTAVKDGDDWYFYVDGNRNVRMYANYKDFKVETDEKALAVGDLVLEKWKEWKDLPKVTTPAEKPKTDAE